MKKAKNTETKLTIIQESNGFVMIPYSIAKNNKMSDSAIRLYNYLKSHTDSFNLSYESIAKYLHKSAKTIQRTIEELKENGFLIMEKKPNSNNYTYRLLNTPKKEKLKVINKESILKNLFNNNIDFNDIFYLYKNKQISLKEYQEIQNEILRILKTNEYEE